jgi:hypothetical protein
MKRRGHVQDRLAKLEQRLGIGQKILLHIIATSRAEYDEKLAEARARYGPDADFNIIRIWLGDGPMPDGEAVP